MTDVNYLDDVGLLDPSAQEAMEFSAPSVQWVNGKQSLKQVGGVPYTGGFLFPYEYLTEGATIPRWEPARRVVGDGKEIEGLGCAMAGISIVRYRRRWVSDDNIVRSWNNYEPGLNLRSHMQAVGFIKGYPDPVCFTWKGMSMENVLTALQEHHRKIVSLVNKTIPADKPKLPTYAFWLGIKPGAHAMVGQGQKKSEVTPPTLFLPKAVTLDYCKGIYVGREVLLASQQLFHELDSWVKNWDRDGAPKSPEHNGHAATSAPMGEYQGEPSEQTAPTPAPGAAVIDEDDLPF